MVDQPEVDRQHILLLFDVDGTLTPARQCMEKKVYDYIQSLRERGITVGLVGGSDIKKITEQTVPIELKSPEVDPLQDCINHYDYVFAENGLDAYKNGHLLAKRNLVTHLGEEKLQRFINFCLAHLSTITLPAKRGNFIEFRNGMINVSPVGRSCSQSERLQFNAYDNEHKIRQKFIDLLESKFGANSSDPLGLSYSIGGQISFDVFPTGWDKTYCLDLVDSKFEEIHFFGDKTYSGGNDYEIFIDSRTIGHSVRDPDETLEILETLNL